MARQEQKELSSMLFVKELMEVQKMQGNDFLL